MASSTFDSYAAKVCRHAELPQKAYASNSLNTVILNLPFAEAHLVLDGREATELPRLGETRSLQEHLQAAFFDVVRLPKAELFLFTAPVLIKKVFLERLEGWREWRTLAAYLAQSDLEPTIVFKNTPIPIKESPFETNTYYLADVRVIFVREEPFVWEGD